MPSTPTPTKKIRNQNVDGSGRYVLAPSSSTSMTSNDVKPNLAELNGIILMESDDDSQVELVSTNNNNTVRYTVRVPNNADKEKIEAMLLFDPSKQYFEFLNFIEHNGRGVKKWLGKCKSCNKNFTVKANVTSNMTTHLKKVFMCICFHFFYQPSR